jgi:alkylation response protein AidB-like acyl-CoA dehydrogenase
MTDPILERARSLRPLLLAQSARIEKERRLPAEVVAALAQADLMRLLAPRSVGGSEASVRTLVDVIESIATADSAAGWCLMVHATTSLVGGYLPISEARAMFGDPSSASCGVFAPMGKGTREDGGYRLVGRWSFASGCEHARWRLLGFVAQDGDTPRLLQAILPAEDTEVVDTWDVSGLRGTGSHDLVAHGARVDDAWTISLTGAPRETGALYRFPVFGLLALGVSAVSLGIARAALDALAGLAAKKKPHGGGRTLAERELVHAEVARAEASLRAARALVHETIDEVDARVARGDAMTLADRASLRLAATHATERAAFAVDVVQRLAGSASVYEAQPFARFHRDVHVATQHVMVGDGTYVLAGRTLLGQSVDATLL